MPDLPTGTVTFLFTDIEGSTKRWEANPDAMRPALARHDEIMRQAIEANSGHVFKTIGDAFCAAFHTASDAAAATLAAQLALAAEPWAVDPPVRARMALHTGAAEERQHDYFGQPVNRVARLLSAGHGGQTLVSLVTQELIRDTLPPGCTLIDMGDASLKDLTRPERVFQLQHPDLPSRFPPLKTLNSPELPNNLPQQATSFIGREKELAEVSALLSSSRLLTLVGPGGAGKTRLSLQAAADLLGGDSAKDGVWLIELAPLTDSALVASEVARTLDIMESGGEPIQKTLVNALKTKSLVLVLDNCEHVVHACASLAADLLRACPNVRILATSREPLGTPGEQSYRIPSLSVPAITPNRSKKTAYTAESLSQFDSVRLFIERAKAVQPAFAVTDDNAPAVAQICANLDGAPLAIELAAARVRSLPVEQINARLDQRFRLLTGGARTLLPRQQTLKALIDWSYDLLTDQEKLLLERLSVFAGGWALEAAESVCAGEDETAGVLIEDWEMLDLLTSLTDKSLVVYEEQEAGANAGAAAGAFRYRLLESLRQYGRDRLDERGHAEVAATHSRHQEWCATLALQAEPELTGASQAEWLSRLESENDNLRAALDWSGQGAAASDAAVADSEPPPAALRIVAAVWRFWYMRGYLTEGRQWLSKVLDQLPDPDTDSPETLHLRGKALNGLGGLANEQGDHKAARDWLQQALEIRRLSGDLKAVASSLNNLGNVAYNVSDYDSARALYEESLRLSRELGDSQGVAFSLGSLGNVAVDQRDYPTARALYEESLALMRQLSDLQGTAITLNNLGNVLRELGEHDAAFSALQECLDLRRELGDQLGISVALGNLGCVLSEGHGDYEAARVLQQESLEIARQVGDKDGIATALENLGSLARRLRDYPAARAALNESIALCLQIGNLWSTRAVLDSIASLALAETQWNRAAHLWSAAAALAQRINVPLDPGEQRDHEANYAAARQHLGDTAFEAAWSAGEAMTVEQAVEYAQAV